MMRLARVLGVRSGEGRLILRVAVLFAAIEAARGFGEIAVDTLFISRFGAPFLPYAFMALGGTSLVAALAFGAALGRFRRDALFIRLLGGLALLLVAQRIVVLPVPQLVPVAWLTVYAAGAIVVTVSWTVAGSVFDARQAKRLFPICTSAAIAGGFVGTVGAGPVARLVGTDSLVVIQALLLAGAAVVVREIGREGAAARLRGRGTGESLRTELSAGLGYVARSPLMRLVAVAYLLFAVLMFSVTFPFLTAMGEAFPREADLATALGLLSAGVTATSFIVALAVAPRVYARFGVATGALVLPVVYLAGFVLWLVQFSVGTAALVRVVQQVTQRGLSNAAWSAFYNVVPAERRAQVLAFNDGVPGQIGIALSGVLLLVAGSLLAPDQVFWLGVVAAAACTAVVIAIRRAYGRSLVRTLRAGLAEQVLEGGPGLTALAGDPQVASALVAGLDAPQPAVRRMAAQLLGRVGSGTSTDRLMAALDDEDAGVRAAALDALAASGVTSRAAPRIAGRLADPAPEVRRAAIRAAASLDGAAVDERSELLALDPDPHVRAELAVALIGRGEEDRPHALLADLLEAGEPRARMAGLEAVGRLGGHDPSSRIPEFLADPSPEVRASAVRALSAVDGGWESEDPFIAALDDDARVVREAAAAALRARPSPPRAVFDVLATGSPRAQEAAMRSLNGHATAAREPLLAWASGRVARAASLRRYRLGLEAVTSPGAADDRLDFLAFVLRRREAEIELRLLDALAVLGAPEAGGLIRRCLRSNDPDTRAQAIEAIDSLGDGRLRRAIVALLEDDPTVRDADRQQLLHELSDDPDPWVRVLAVHAGSRESTTDAGGSGMPETSRTVGDIERMLFLRRVPLFAQLEPEDLQRLAAAATERLYGPEETIVREGDIGHELVIILEGAVRVVRIVADGGERLLRRYEAGDHIGELAVLRERPRAATVIAEAPGVRGLVMGGDALMAILRERPEAAMAMLGTLAERIGTQ